MSQRRPLTPEEISAIAPRWPLQGSSWIWQHSCLRPDEDVALCFYCGYQVAFVNPSNMAVHLETTHKLRDIRELVKKRKAAGLDQPTLTEAFAPLSPSRRETLRKEVIIFLATSGIAFNIVRSASFERLLSVQFDDLKAHSCR
jgi:hypothetical protein